MAPAQLPQFRPKKLALPTDDPADAHRRVPITSFHTATS